MPTHEKQVKRIRRHRRVRAKVFGTKDRPRLCVFRSNRYIYAQLIDDEKGHTLAASSDLNSKKDKKDAKEGKIYAAFKVGKLIAQKAKKKKITKAIFDRGGFKYHGRVKAVIEGAREGGIKF